MSEPTYRIILTHKPEDGAAVCWSADVYAEAEYEADPSYVGGTPATAMFQGWGATREAAFDRAQAWCKAKASEPEAPSTVFLTEDGELFDRHEVQA